MHQVARAVTAGFVAALLTAVCAAPASSASGWESLQRRTSPPSVWTAARTGGTWMYGDSITVGNYAPLAAAAGPGRLAVDANSGIPTYAAVDRLAGMVAQRGAPARLIMAVGSNDAVNGAPAGDVIASQAARVRRIVGPSTRIVWVTVWVSRTKVDAKTAERDVAGTLAVNAALDDARRTRVINGVVDWAAFLARRPGLPGYYLRDGVHPNPLGGDAWRALIRPHLPG